MPVISSFRQNKILTSKFEKAVQLIFRSYQRNNIIPRNALGININLENHSNVVISQKVRRAMC
jgi:hypothetical protein